MKVSLEKIRLDLKVNWKLSRNETLFKENFIISLKSDDLRSRGEIAPNIRYKEDEKIILDNFDSLKSRIKKESLAQILSRNNFCNSFRFGLDSANTHLRALKQDKKVFEFLKLKKPRPVATSYTVPIMTEDKLEKYLKDIERFKFVKIKVNQDNAAKFCLAISKLTKAPLRIDGNETWSGLDSYLDFEKKVRHLNIELIEQPFKADELDIYQRLKAQSQFPIFADESITDKVDFDLIEKCFHGVNIKLMKAGGYANALSLLKEAKQRGLKTMLGCMIETSLGISSALNLSEFVDHFDLDGSLLIKNDPFNLIFENKGDLYFS